ncbi:MAG: hypothetical protein GY941_05745, partial [Planctomycetes bacterium]|nr:hypothetical protein [Planctomycetota bacterium]
MIQKEVVNVQNQTGVNSFYTQMIVAILYIVVIAVPLYYDIRLYSVFDLSKVTVLYILVFSIIVIWSLKTLSVCWKDNKHPDHTSREEMQGVSEKSSIIGYPYASFSAAKPLHLPVLALVGISTITTFFSISPFTSLLGTYKRYDGLVSTLVYVVLFYTVVHFIDRKRVSVFLDVIISTACVASVY